MAYFGFISQNYKMSLRFIQYILNSSTGEGRVFISFAKLLFVIIHYELGNESIVRRQMIFFSKDILIYNGEAHKLILNFLEGDIRNVYKVQERRRQLAFLKVEIENIMKRDASIEILAEEYFNVYSWVKSKVEGISVANVIKQKAIAVYGKAPF